MRIPYWMEDLMDNPIFKWVTIAMVGLVVAVVAAVVLGFSSTLLFLLLVGLVIYFGSIRILAGSVIVGVLLKVVSPVLVPFVLVGFPGPGTLEFFALVQKTGYFNLVSCIFLVVFTIRFVTGSVKLVELKTTVNNNFPKAKKDDE